ncbi:MAG: GH116 family glycosyl-hydrolase [Acutalibacteraceae bacterium]|nr:GH116 family glycosyl-hydrolase [Acutalibacteraceae bacterium]
MIYKGEFTNEISFPLGGLGSGCIGLQGNGVLREFEIFNKPNKKSYNGFTHFAIKAKTKNGVITKILNGDKLTEFSNINGMGVDQPTMAGFPHFKNHTFKGEFPIAEIYFSDESFPADITLRAFNPFIPLDEDNSSIPAAFFEIDIKNKTSEDIEFTTAFTSQNPFFKGSNTSTVKDGYRLLTFNKENVDNSENFEPGDLTIACDEEDSLVQTYWFRGAWQDKLVTYWNNFNNENDVQDRIYSEPNSAERDHGTLCAKRTILANETKTVRFIFSWNIPVNHNFNNFEPKKDGNLISFKNYYAVLWENSQASAVYSLSNWNKLKEKTVAFKNALHSQTLDETVIDAISSTLSVLKSPTVLRFEDGSFHGWEGAYSNRGSCEGTCQHVYNYAYALCFLFPNLERGIRHNEFVYATEDSGLSHFRMYLPLGINKGWPPFACLDGTMGMVIKSYREWKISGDDNWLKEHWNYIKRAVDFARSEENPHKWDLDGDGILEGRQHHTLDMELFGPSSWLEGMYLAALKAAAEMADYLGDNDTKETYEKLYENGKKWTKENLFNGKHFIQKIDLNDKSIIEKFDADNYWNNETGEIKYQIGEGSSIDQLLGQWHADILSLGDIFDAEQIDTALDTMCKLNYVDNVREYTNPWRIFALNDEAGSFICSYDKDSRKPLIPVPYCEEMMTGFEYSFACELIYRGKVDEGIKVIKAVRDRYDGKKRNPYNEIECGNNYVRPMAAFSFINAFSGFSFHLPKSYIGFNPIINKDNFKSIFSLGTGWGTYEQTETSATIKIESGSLELSSLKVGIDNVSELTIDGNNVNFTIKDGILCFDKMLINKEITVK